jgi:hypothetical protein
MMLSILLLLAGAVDRADLCRRALLDAARNGWLQHRASVTAIRSETSVVQISLYDSKAASFADVTHHRVLATYTFDSTGRSVSAIAGPAKPQVSPEMSQRRLQKVVGVLLAHPSAIAWLKNDVTVSFRPDGAMFYRLRGRAGDWQFFQILKDDKTIRVHSGY